jgi:hypothetical protein
MPMFSTAAQPSISVAIFNSSGVLVKKVSSIDHPVVFMCGATTLAAITMSSY